ncbi:UBX domain-containing protein [Xylaria bambusicola]|uniref:UBX domain-containing protein n=1 Tax=Xylaria bambusicola TaxID=326684 RepID=UPI00200751D7|nr:UBX domain-containing protein [Xylaria bambusicola]KAI0520996.1 UBX domain-containing protein [Xylaria bambusicola]
MASGAGVDISHLSADQRAALEQYTQVTAQDTKDAVPLLERSQWNVQIAIAKFFDGEGPDPVAEAIAAGNQAPQQQSRHENLQESLLASSSPYGRPRPRERPDPAPRIVPQPTTTRRTPFLLAIIFAPFNFGYRAVSAFFRTFVYIFAFLPPSLRPRALTTSMTTGFRGSKGRRMLMPPDTAARLRREFEEEYGTNALPFHEGGFAQALDLAKRDLKFLLIVLMSPEHDDTESFTRDTLLAPEVTNFINDPANNIILWGGNVLDSEAYQVAAEYNCTKFPFSCLVCLTPKEGSTRMSIVKRLAGPLSPSTYLAEIQTAINKYAPDLAGVRAERTAQQVSRNLRTEQDDAYERSLARDRERARQRKEAEAAAAETERKAQEEAEAAERRERQRQQWRRWRATTIKPEPGSNADPKDVVRLALMLPVAGRIVRRFAAATTVEELYAFVECYDMLTTNPELNGEDEKREGEDGQDDDEIDLPAEKPEGYVHEYGFRIASPMPRVVYEPDAKATLSERIGRSGNLIVELGTDQSDGESDPEES